MGNIILTDILKCTADLLLPDSCALCGASLCLERLSGNIVPLCSSCRKIADDAIYKKTYSSIRRCGICGYPLTSENCDCLSCREKTWNFHSATSLFLYSGPGRELICSYKFNNRRGLSSYFAELIFNYHKIHHPDSIIVPVPFRPASKRKRGWDQIEEIAKVLQKTRNVSVSSCLKRDNGPAQKKMNYESRLLNLNGKIHLKKYCRPPVKALLLDDVFTTGATLDYCARILKDAGTSEINCIAIALDL